LNEEMTKLKIKTGDTVRITTGDHKGTEGKVMRVDAEKNKAIVEGANMVSKHEKPSANNPQGGIVKKEAPIDISNLSFIPRLKQEYKERVVKALSEEFGYKNVMQVPKLKKIVVSRGVGAAVADKKLIDHAVEELTMITGQKAISTMSKKDVALCQG